MVSQKKIRINMVYVNIGGNVNWRILARQMVSEGI